MSRTAASVDRAAKKDRKAFSNGSSKPKSRGKAVVRDVGRRETGGKKVEKRGEGKSASVKKVLRRAKQVVGEALDKAMGRHEPEVEIAATPTPVGEVDLREQVQANDEAGTEPEAGQDMVIELNKARPGEVDLAQGTGASVDEVAGDEALEAKAVGDDAGPVAAAQEAPADLGTATAAPPHPPLPSHNPPAAAAPQWSHPEVARGDTEPGAGGEGRIERRRAGRMSEAGVPMLAVEAREEQMPPIGGDDAASRPAAPIGADEPPAETNANPPLCFEVAWEVCWQLGGIYTVLRSKIAAMQERWGDRYCLIGPYNPSTAALEFEEAPTEGVIRETLDKLRAQGIACHFGRWLVTGRPRVILLDYRARYGSLDTDKYLLWKDHGIPTYAGDGEVNDVVAFGFTVAEFFRLLHEAVTDRPVLAHFHEWMGGVAVPRIAHLRLPTATVFTTHATLLGRYLASDNPHFYDNLHWFNPDDEATKYNIYPRFAIERAAAHASTVFTTVSDVTNREAEKLLGRSADVILPNGLNIQRFTALHEFQNYHRQYKERIHEFVMGHFFPSYSFDLDRTLYFFTSGRYEYRNKGYDLFIEAMWRLNHRLKTLPNPPTVVSFVVTKAAVNGISVGALQSQAQFDELKETCIAQQQAMGRKLFLAAVNGRIPTHIRELIDDDASVKLKRAIHAWRSSRWPSIVTHDLADDANDPVLKHLRHRHLFNATDDPVKLIFHPQFVQSTSPLLSLDYDAFVRGCHMGIFPSYYEPWGYTPMEAVALGVPAVTTDLSGFGTYVQQHLEDSRGNGIMVLNRARQGFDQSADELADYLFQFCQLNRRQRIELRNRVEARSTMFDWSQLARHYHDAHDLALQRKGSPAPGRLEVRVV